MLKYLRFTNPKYSKTQRLEKEIEFHRLFNTTLIGALTFTAALFWRDWLTALLDLLPEMEGVIGKFFVAFFITISFVIVISRLNKIVIDKEKQLAKEHERKNKDK